MKFNTELCINGDFFLTLHFSSTGDVVLKDLKLKAEALNSLQLPLRVKAGFVGTITLKVLLESSFAVCLLAIS